MELKATFFLRTFAFLKIPLIFFVKPTVVEFTDEKTVVKIPLGFRTKNHVGSMYFGVLATGADCAGGLLAIKLSQAYGKRATPVFKDFSAEFLKRATDDVFFICEEGAAARALVEKAAKSGERENCTVSVRAECKGELVARFKLTLSIRIKPA